MRCVVSAAGLAIVMISHVATSEERISVLATQPFPLEEVRLLDGPFKEAMERDKAYLLSLKPDRLLAWFRKEAGLEPKGEVYGGWETQGVAGHTLGHYLSACSLMFAATGDERLKQIVAYCVEELAACQKANGDGYVGAIPQGKRVFSELAAGHVDAKNHELNGIWVPWYTEHKVFAGLLDAHRYVGIAEALHAARQLGDWAISVTASLDPTQIQRMLSCEYGGMNESFCELYAITGDSKHLQAANSFYHADLMDPLAEGKNSLVGRHANTQIPKITGVARQYEVTGIQKYRDVAEFFWNEVVDHYTYVNGGNSENEHFPEPDSLAAHMEGELTETCNTYNMLKLTNHLFAWRPSGKYADYYERALYNHILASQDERTGMVTYKFGLYGGHFQAFSTPENSFWCCVGTGMENHARYGEAIYFHDADGVYVNLFIPSTLTWKEKGLSARMETRYPEDGLVTLRIENANPSESVAFRVRRPGWAKGSLDLKVNGEAMGESDKSDTSDDFFVVVRKWAKNDVIEFRIPLLLRLERTPDNPNRLAILCGPVVLAGALGAENMPPEGPYGYVSDVEWKLPLPSVPCLGGVDRPIGDWIQPVDGEPLTFRTVNAGVPNDVTLMPIWRTHHQRFNVYWDVTTESK